MARRSGASPTNVWVEGRDRFGQVMVPFTTTASGNYVIGSCIGTSVDISSLFPQRFELTATTGIFAATTNGFAFTAVFTEDPPGGVDLQAFNLLTNPIGYFAYSGGGDFQLGARRGYAAVIRRVINRTKPTLYLTVVSSFNKVLTTTDGLYLYFSFATGNLR